MKTLTTTIFLLISLVSLNLNAQSPTGNEPLISVSQYDNESYLIWTTEREVNSKYFLVEASTDSIHFETLKSIPASGNSLFTETYEPFEVSDIPVTFVRVTLIDMNGRRYSSAVARIPYSDTATATIR